MHSDLLSYRTVNVQLQSPYEPLGCTFRQLQPATLVIHSVNHGSPFHRASLSPGTAVVAIDGIPVPDSEAFEAALASFQAKNKLVLPVQVIIAEHQETVHVKLNHPFDDYGMQFQKRSDGPIYVSQVMPGSPCEKAGMVPGSVLRKFGGHLVGTEEDIKNAVTTLRQRGETEVDIVVAFLHEPNSPIPSTHHYQDQPDEEYPDEDDAYDFHMWNPKYPPPPKPRGGGVGGPLPLRQSVGRASAAPQLHYRREVQTARRAGMARTRYGDGIATIATGSPIPAPLHLKRDPQGYFDNYQAPDFEQVTIPPTQRVGSLVSPPRGDLTGEGPEPYTVVKL
eukprot:Sspe_Gene.71683::Locus_42578_Transcript_1_1_Confidence_1.000_Length_1618::g.71683::m.71683